MHGVGERFEIEAFKAFSLKPFFTTPEQVCRLFYFSLKNRKPVEIVLYPFFFNMKYFENKFLNLLQPI